MAESLGTGQPTIYSWFHCFRQDGLDGLANQPFGRQKRKAEKAYCQALEEAIEHDPSDYGYPFAIWTVERLRDHLEKETGVRMSVSRLRVVIRRRSFVYRRTQARSDQFAGPGGQGTSPRTVGSAKKGVCTDHQVGLLYMDKTILSLHPPLRAWRMKRGQQKCIPTPGVQQVLHLFGACRFEEDSLVWKAGCHKNSQAFIEFLEHLFVECYPTAHFILALDNASYHQSRATLAALSLFEPRVRVY